MNRTLVASISLVALTAAVSSCGQAPPQAGGSSAGATPSAGGFQACMVTDAGGIDDRSFNQSAWDGIKQAESAGGVKGTYVVSKANNEYAPNVQQMVSGNCGIIVTVGFLLGDATKAAAEKNPDEKFAIVDFAYQQPVANVKPLIFDTAQASFLAGYASAAASRTGVVATYGGVRIPTVTIFMDGFVDGVAHFNKAKGKNVKVLGWDKKNGSFTGDFENQQNGQNVTRTFMQQGADVVMPVAGPVGQGTLQVAQGSGGKLMVVGVDTDWVVSSPKFKDVVLTSVMKQMAVAVDSAVRDTAKGSFSNAPYVGTLANKGVDIAPFHSFETKVPPTLATEIAALKQQISSGALKVVSPNSPKQS